MLYLNGTDAGSHWCDEVQRMCIKYLSDERETEEDDREPIAELVEKTLEKLYFIKFTPEKRCRMLIGLSRWHDD